MPVESWSILLSRLASSSTKLEQLVDPDPGFLAGDVEEAGEDQQVLADRQVDVQGDLLGDDAGHGLDGPVVDGGGQAVDR